MKEKIIFLGITLVMLIVIIGSSYAFLSSQSESSKNHIVKAGKLEEEGSGRSVFTSMWYSQRPKGWRQGCCLFLEVCLELLDFVFYY